MPTPPSPNRPFLATGKECSSYLSDPKGRNLMPLHPSIASRERILAFGPYGSGKSWAWMNIMEWYIKTGAKGRFYCIDTDFNWDDVGHLYPNAPIEVANCESLSQMKAAARKFKASANPTRGDWLVVDMINKAWVWAQEEFHEAVTGKDYDVFLIEAKKNNINIGGDYGSNWGIINASYRQFIDPVVRFPGNIFACTGADEVRKPEGGKKGDDEEIVKVYGRVGYKPTGQKELGHQFRSVLLFQDSAKGWRLSSVKDRGRERLNGAVLESFVTSYLMKVGGWKP